MSLNSIQTYLDDNIINNKDIQPGCNLILNYLPRNIDEGMLLVRYSSSFLSFLSFLFFILFFLNSLLFFLPFLLHFFREDLQNMVKYVK